MRTFYNVFFFHFYSRRHILIRANMPYAQRGTCVWKSIAETHNCYQLHTAQDTQQYCLLPGKRGWQLEGVSLKKDGSSADTRS